MDRAQAEPGVKSHEVGRHKCGQATETGPQALAFLISSQKKGL